MGLGSVGQVPTIKQAPDTIDSVLSEIQTELNRLFSLCSGIDSAADRIEGSRPVETAEGQPPTPPRSFLDDLQHKRDRLRVLLDDGEHALSRIVQALGGPNIPR